LLAERAATGSATGIMSAGVRIHAHQVNAALRITRDPVQRYLLADEVGMGKTIQAGFVIRQLLIDDPSKRIGVIAPEALVHQWESELEGKFYLGDFGDPYLIKTHNDQAAWRNLAGVDLLVIDEAHLLARTDDPSTSPYAELAALTHSVPRVLLLSATPFAQDDTTHLALLHLLDPVLFRWEEIEQFRLLLTTRRELGLAVFGLDVEPDPENPELLEYQFHAVQTLLPEDTALKHLIADAMAAFVDDVEPGIATTDLNRKVAAVRTHISETYRLHHRVIRNRRHTIQQQQLDDEGLTTPFDFTGRSRPSVIRLNSLEVEAAAAAVEDWLSSCSAVVLDESLDARAYGAVAGILVSRLGGPVQDLQAILEYRVSECRSPRGVSSEELQLLGSAPMLPFEKKVLSSLADVGQDDGLSSLVAAISKRCPPNWRSIVFCGPGLLGEQLYVELSQSDMSRRHVYSHLASQSPEAREEAIIGWRKAGGVLVVDHTGDVGRNFQDANLVIHARMPWNPNHLEQRIGRVDRYGDSKTARQFVISDPMKESPHGRWLRLLAGGYGVFNESISGVQESVEKQAAFGWESLISEGLEAFEAQTSTIQKNLTDERRRINEMDALEASYDYGSLGTSVADQISRYEGSIASIERDYRLLIEGAEGFRFLGNSKADGSTLFERDWMNKPLLSPRLLSRLNASTDSRTGLFDRWRTINGRRLFRRGNPFIDGIETILELDDRGQASALWRIDPLWDGDPLVYFGFDYIIEADPEPVLHELGGDVDMRPIAVRRADTAFPPFQMRIWMAVNSSEPVKNSVDLRFLNSPFDGDRRDVNLNLTRISALHGLLGGEASFNTVAISCEAAAQNQLETMANLKSRCESAAKRVRRETDVLLTQNRARQQASRIAIDLTDPEVEAGLGRALEQGVLSPLTRLTSVTCLVRSATSWSTHV
jgi:ATP-dependent helicase HepA